MRHDVLWLPSTEPHLEIQSITVKENTRRGLPSPTGRAVGIRECWNGVMEPALDTDGWSSGLGARSTLPTPKREDPKNEAAIEGFANLRVAIYLAPGMQEEWRDAAGAGAAEQHGLVDTPQHPRPFDPRKRSVICP